MYSSCPDEEVFDFSIPSTGVGHWDGYKFNTLVLVRSWTDCVTSCLNIRVIKARGTYLLDLLVINLTQAIHSFHVTWEFLSQTAKSCKKYAHFLKSWLFVVYIFFKLLIWYAICQYPVTHLHNSSHVIHHFHWVQKGLFCTWGKLFVFPV